MSSIPLLPVIIGSVAALLLISQAILDLVKRWVFIVPFVASLAIIASMTVMNYSAPGQDLAKWLISGGVVAVLVVSLILDLKFNDETKIGGADVLGFISIVATFVGVGIMYSITGEPFVELIAWAGNNILAPLVPIMIVLGILEYAVYKYKTTKGGDPDYMFQAPVVPAIVIIHILMFVSSSIQYL